MYIRTFNRWILLGLFLGFVFSGCGPKPITKESILDTPDNHYSQGLRELEAGQLEAAVEEFQRATALNPDYPGGYIGIGLVMAERKDFKAAYESVNKGIDKDNKFIDGPIAKGRIIVMEKQGDDWLDKSINQFEDALKIDPESEKAVYYSGMAYKEAYEFGEAANAFSKVIAIKGDFAQEANAEWELVQKIQRAAPGTKIGASIALIPEIDRADLAVLFVEELKLLEVLQKNQPQVYDTRFRPPVEPTEMQTSRTEQMATVTDIESHWAKNWIEDVVKAGVIDVFPDHTFRPDEK
ncbi:tetratricopeptide repeat protein, partial [bacterium]|nr:tetratricopeptide repeat protein [bacterium]